MTDHPKRDLTEAELDDFLLGFSVASPDALAPSDDFLARVEAQAREVMPAAQSVAVTRTTRAASAAESAGPDSSGGPLGLLATLWQGLGGWPAVSGLTAVLALGIGLGIAPPTTGLQTLTEAVLGAQSTDTLDDVLWGFDTTLLEG